MEFVNLAEDPESAVVRKQMVKRLDAYLDAFPQDPSRPAKKK
jgi:hypothetical protein